MSPSNVGSGARRVYLSRWVCLSPESNLARIAEEAGRAAAAGAELCVFPESFLHGYTRQVPPAEARATFAAESAAHPRLTFAFGSFSEDRRNRMTLWRGGCEQARYDKVHLFEPNGEHEIWVPGSRYVAADLGGWTVGLVNCNDIRFPEQSRALRLSARCDALLVVAWWPWRRDHVWETLLRARAIENGVFTIGCCVAASTWPGEEFAGAGNHVFDPLGEPLRTADDHVYDLDLSRAEALVVDPLRTFREVADLDVVRVV
jgi:predicted amidohydrolase